MVHGSRPKRSCMGMLAVSPEHQENHYRGNLWTVQTICIPMRGLLTMLSRHCVNSRRKSLHGSLLGEHAIWGKHCLYEHALRSPLMIRYPGLIQPGQASNSIVESVDIFPTLAELCELTAPANLGGRSLRAQLADPTTPGSKPAQGFWTSGQRTMRTDRWRLIAHPQKDEGEPIIELFDYETDPDETSNPAEANPDVVAELLAKLKLLPEFESRPKR